MFYKIDRTNYGNFYVCVKIERASKKEKKNPAPNILLCNTLKKQKTKWKSSLINSLRTNEIKCTEHTWSSFPPKWTAICSPLLTFLSDWIQDSKSREKTNSKSQLHSWLLFNINYTPKNRWRANAGFSILAWVLSIKRLRVYAWNRLNKLNEIKCFALIWICVLLWLSFWSVGPAKLHHRNH